jgi:hypothetical protein
MEHRTTKIFFSSLDKNIFSLKTEREREKEKKKEYFINTHQERKEKEEKKQKYIFLQKGKHYSQRILP